MSMGICFFGHAWLAHVGSKFCMASLSDQLELWSFSDWVKWVEAHVYGAKTFLDCLGALLGPCLNHFWPLITSRQASALRCSRLSHHSPVPISMECLHIRTIFGSLQTSYRYEISRLSQYCLLTISIECLHLGALSGPFWDHIWTMFCLASFQSR